MGRRAESRKQEKQTGARRRRMRNWRELKVEGQEESRATGGIGHRTIPGRERSLAVISNSSPAARARARIVEGKSMGRSRTHSFNSRGNQRSRPHHTNRKQSDVENADQSIRRPSGQKSAGRAG